MVRQESCKGMVKVWEECGFFTTGQRLDGCTRVIQECGGLAERVGGTDAGHHDDRHGDHGDGHHDDGGGSCGNRLQEQRTGIHCVLLDLQAAGADIPRFAWYCLA